MEKVWMTPPDDGEPQEVEATPDVLVPLLVQGWRQIEPPEEEEEQEEVDDDAREHS